MIVNYSKLVLEDLSSIDPMQAHMLLDYFEHKYQSSEVLMDGAYTFKSGIWRILFTQDDRQITVLRVIQ